MLKTIKNDIFNICNRIKAIDKNYSLFFNDKLQRYEIYYKQGFNLQLEIVLSKSVPDSRILKRIYESRVEKIEKIIKEIEENNQKIEEEKMRNLKDELISKVKMIIKKGV